MYRIAQYKKIHFHQDNGRGEVIRTLDPLHPMQVRYQAALRPDRKAIIAAYTGGGLAIEHRDNTFQLTLHEADVESDTCLCCFWGGDGRLIQTIAGSVNGEAVLIEQFANPSDQQHLVVLIVAPVSTAFEWFELRKFLLPIAKHVWLHAAQLAHFANREISLGWNDRQATVERRFH